ncbi:MAG: ribonuclease, Rne/Rng family [Acidobacteria bacterium]|nr:ribonuclease, Rne/Rng family [Acidobacteriota bacterium]
MVKEMIVNTTALETKVAILEDDQLAELYIERNRSRGILGNIYKGKVTKVLPGMQSAFVNIGLDKDAFLYVSDFIEDSEEYDKVLTAAEEQVAKVMAEMDVQERPQRRERKNERGGRWRERRERHEMPRPVPPPTADTALLEKWVLASETENVVSGLPEGIAVGEIQEIPGPVELPPFTGLPQEVTESRGDGEDSAPADLLPVQPAEPAPDDLPVMEGARMTDQDDTMAFTEGGDSPRSSFSARRRGPAARRKRYTAARHTKRTEHQSIDDVLREGQEILVQIAKEPIGKKGARVTSHIALPGRYLVYMPTVDHVGVSRKIGSDGERIRLKEIILKHRELFNGGVIVRTAAEERKEEDLANDLRFLVRLWDDIRERTEKTSAPALIHSELNLVQRILRDHFSFEFQAVRVDDEAEYQRIVEFVDKIYPNMVHRVKLYTRPRPIFDEFGINTEIDKLLQPKIWLKSGGYIVINQTEALVSIDINTGKFVGKGNSLEETITRTNLEAVKEIVKQIRLRDLGGIIVIDFIDMDERKNRKRVMEALSQELAQDKAPSKILEFNEFGLVAITRKRVKQSLERTLCQPCNYCGGSGMVKSVATTCYAIYHEIEKMKDIGDGRDEVMIRVHPDVARALRESESAVVEEIRHLLKKDVAIKADPSLHIEHFNIIT